MILLERSRIRPCHGWDPYRTCAPIGVVAGVKGMVFLVPQFVQHWSKPDEQELGVTVVEAIVVDTDWFYKIWK